MPRRLLFRLLASVPSATDHVPDAELLRRFATSNDPAAFELIVRRHADAVWAACRRLLRSDADAEDAFQATFLALIRKARSIRTPSAGGWLHQVAVHASLKLRERIAHTSLVEPKQLIGVPSPARDEPDADRAAVVHEELARLPERERLPVVLCDLEGLSHADAAQALGWPVGTVSGRLSRARAKLRDRLARRGLAPSAGLLPMLAAPPRLISTAVSLTAGAPPAVVSLTEGVLVMMAQATWKWIAVVAVCASTLGMGAVLAFMPGAGQPGEGTPAPRNSSTPAPVTEPAPPEKDKSEGDLWLPKLKPNGFDSDTLATAFPDLVRPQLDLVDPEKVDPKQKEEMRKALFAKACPRMVGTIKITIEPTDDTLRKLLKARLYQGVLEIQRLRGLISKGEWHPEYRLDLYECLTDIQAMVTELWDTQPKELIPWLEELVVAAKDMESFHKLRVEIGADSPFVLEAARRHRLAVETALWKAKKRA